MTYDDFPKTKPLWSSRTLGDFQSASFSTPGWSMERRRHPPLLHLFYAAMLEVDQPWGFKTGMKPGFSHQSSNESGRSRYTIETTKKISVEQQIRQKSQRIDLQLSSINGSLKPSTSPMDIDNQVTILGRSKLLRIHHSPSFSIRFRQDTQMGADLVGFFAIAVFASLHNLLNARSILWDFSTPGAPEIFLEKKLCYTKKNSKCFKLIRDIKTSIKQRNNYIHMYSHVFTYWQRNGVSTKRNVVSVFFYHMAIAPAAAAEVLRALGPPKSWESWLRTRGRVSSTSENHGKSWKMMIYYYTLLCNTIHMI